MTNYKGDNKTELPLGKLNLMSNVPYILLESIFFNFINSSLFYLFFFQLRQNHVEVQNSTNLI